MANQEGELSHDHALRPMPPWRFGSGEAIPQFGVSANQTPISGGNNELRTGLCSRAEKRGWCFKAESARAGFGLSPLPNDGHP
jgi:hypothetical protein